MTQGGGLFTGRSVRHKVVACLQVGLCDTRWWLVYRSVCVTQGGGLFTARSVRHKVVACLQVGL